MNRRTTISAAAEDLATLESEARRRGISLTTVLAEAVKEKATEIRRTHRPRLGLGRSADGRSAVETVTKPIQPMS